MVLSDGAHTGIICGFYFLQYKTDRYHKPGLKIQSYLLLPRVKAILADSDLFLCKSSTAFSKSITTVIATTAMQIMILGISCTNERLS